MYDYSISNKVYENVDRGFINSLEFSYDEDEKIFIITSIIKNEITEKISIDFTSPEYYFLMRMLNTQGYIKDFEESLSFLLSYINHSIPKNRIFIVKMNN